MLGHLKRLSTAVAGVAAVRLPSYTHSSAEECPQGQFRKEFSQQRTTNFNIGKHWYGKLRVRVMKVHRDSARGVHSVSEYTVHTKLHAEAYKKCYTHGDNTDVISTDTQKNNVYLVAKRTPVSSPEQFGVDLARHFLSEYPMLDGVEIEVNEHPWERVRIRNAPHDHGFVRASPAQAIANVKLSRDRRNEPDVTSGIRGLTVLKTTQAGWEGFLRDRYTTLGDVDDRCVSTEITCDWKYTHKSGGREPNYCTVRQAVMDQMTQGFFGPAQCGVYSPSVQATIYDIGCMVLESAPDVASISINTPNLHYLPVKLLEQLGEKFEDDIFLPTNEPSGDIFCMVERDEEGAVRQRLKPKGISPAPRQSSCPVSQNRSALQQISREKAGQEFREYAMHGSTERMKPFAKIADVHEAEPSSGRTALHKAAFWGHLDTITYLLDECKLNPNVQDVSGDTALHDAVRFGHAPLVDKLLVSGADKGITNKEGKNVEALAVEYGKTAIAARLSRSR